jgi:diguanylate cyclase (GGDEF)-like protein
VLGMDLNQWGLDLNAEAHGEMRRTVQNHGHWQGEVWGKRKNGEVFRLSLSVTGLTDGRGQVSHHVGVFSDVSVLKAHEEEVQRITYHDALTGLPNRRLLADQMKLAVARALRTGQFLAVCYFDLDDFSHINDTHGHDAGDQVITTIARRLQAEMLPTDTLARLGGDEFVALVHGLKDVAACHALAQRLQSCLLEPIDVGNTTVTVTASLGIALYPQDDVSPDTLLRHADQAMCRAKETGRSQFHVFAAQNDRDARSRRDLFHRLRQALTDHELRLYYQPKVNLRTGEILGFEALIRWQHPDKGLLPPAAFLIDLLDGDLEIDIGNWVIDEAIRQWCEWREAGHAPKTVSVNVSSNQLLKPGFVQELARALARPAGFDARALQLEILESAAITEIDHAAKAMRECLELGVGFALDDFGTGYSSLSHFRRLPVDTLKVDRSFVLGMLAAPDDRAIVAAVVQMARAFDRQVVAEGVETLAHGTALLELGCDVAQGYAIARPMPAADVPTWCTGWRDGWQRDHADPSP